MEKKIINTLFDTLDKWRNFPAYQLERRVDIFFAIYLDEILEKITGNRIDFIIPEFPIRIGEITDNDLNKSYKIDYLTVSEEKKIVYLIELKTDTSSRRENQDWYLKKAKKINVHNLINGVLKIYKATAYKKKYSNYLEELKKIGWIKTDNKNYKNISNDYDIHIIYIQPQKKQTETEFIISFENIIKALSPRKDFITQRFLSSLENWETNPEQVK